MARVRVVLASLVPSVCLVVSITWSFFALRVLLRTRWAKFTYNLCWYTFWVSWNRVSMYNVKHKEVLLGIAFKRILSSLKRYECVGYSLSTDSSTIQGTWNIHLGQKSAMRSGARVHTRYYLIYTVINIPLEEVLEVMTLCINTSLDSVWCGMYPTTNSKKWTMVKVEFLTMRIGYLIYAS